MMGTSHAVSGAAAWIAVTATTLPALGLHPLGPAAVIFGTVVCAGAALLPDADHHNSTIAHAVPVLGKRAAGAIRTISGGHRHGMHSLLAVLGVVLLATALSELRWAPPGSDRALQLGAAAAVAMCAAFAVKVLKIVRRWSRAWVIGALAAAAVLWAAPENVTWLPLCIGLGFAVHLVGDALTVDGVPILWPLNPRSPKMIRRIPVLKSIWKSNGYFAVPILGRAGSAREWLLTVPLTVYAVWGVTASLMLLMSA